MQVRSALNTSLCVLVAALTLNTAPAAVGQMEPGQVHSPHKYLYLNNVSLKPGLSGAFIQHESAEVEALRAANAPVNYFGMMDITGAPRAVYFAGFDSFADLQKDHEQMMANSKLEDTLKTEDAAEASSVAEGLSSIYEYREDLSLRAPVDISAMRFFDITVFHIRSGHHQDWERLVKLYVKAYTPAADAHWAVFEKMYGEGSDNTFIVVTPLASLAGVDEEVLDGDNLPKSVGEDQMQTMRELGSVTIESSESDLFAMVPQISYVPDSWVKGSPDFWGKK
ncbi:MAG TPA: hypothetical protein VMA34_14385 [Terracidiphilus sp.]|nr:hypothetical protein [Terracidiphilus sp.]